MMRQIFLKVTIRGALSLVTIESSSECSVIDSLDDTVVPAAVNSDASGLLTNALGNGLALAVMIYSTAGVKIVVL